MRLRIALLALVAAAAFPAAVLAAAPGSLIKLPCPNGARPDDPCKAVYFYGGDDHRHAFPDERVYFTWYADFSQVQTVSASFMASLPLGRNVTPRPGVHMVKLTTDPKTYAVGLGGTLRWVASESVAASLYGQDWNAKIDDVSDAFFVDFRFGADIASASAFSPQAEQAAATSIDDDLPSSHRTVSVATSSGTFQVDLIKFQKDFFGMRTDSAEEHDCSGGCAAKSLGAYAAADGADFGIHGTYFCPPDYSECVGKENSFLWPFFDTDADVMINESSLAVHQGPLISYSSDGNYRYFHRAAQFGSTRTQFESAYGTALEAAVANYPSLVENGSIVVYGEPKLDDGMRTIKGTRGAIGFSDRFGYLAIVKNATVPDEALALQALGATDAMNLDGGGSAALWYGGRYLDGPGRDLPNAILFKKK